MQIMENKFETSEDTSKLRIVLNVDASHLFGEMHTNNVMKSLLLDWFHKECVV